MAKLLADFDYNYTEATRLRLQNITNAQMVALSLTTSHKGYQIFNTSFGKPFYWNGSSWKNDTYYPTLPSNYYIVDSINYNTSEHKYQTIADAINAAGTFTGNLIIEVMPSLTAYADITIESDNITLIFNSGANIGNLTINANNITILGGCEFNNITQNQDKTGLNIDLNSNLDGNYDKIITLNGSFSYINVNSVNQLIVNSTAYSIYANCNEIGALSLQSNNYVYINANFLGGITQTITTDSSFNAIKANIIYGTIYIYSGSMNLTANKIVKTDISLNVYIIYSESVNKVSISNAYIYYNAGGLAGGTIVYMRDGASGLRLKNCVLNATEINAAIYMEIDNTVITDNCTLLVSSGYSIVGAGTNCIVKNYGSVTNRDVNNVSVRVQDLIIDLDVE